MKKHIFWMIVRCTIPLLLIFFAPALGMSSNASFLIFIIAMFACHLLMPMHHKGRAHDNHSKSSKTANHEHH